MANFNINIGSYVNQPPTIGDGTQTTNYGVPITLTRADFTDNTTPPYFDPEGDLPLNLKVTSLPAEGLLKVNGIDVAVNQEISFVSEIDANLFTYTPNNANTSAHAVAFNFEISDLGSTTYTS